MDNITLKNAIETNLWLTVWAGEPTRQIAVTMTYEDLYIIRNIICSKRKETSGTFDKN